MLSEDFDGYDTVLMVDMDMFAITQENVFEVNGTGLFSGYTQRIFNRCQAEFPDLCDSRFAYWGGAIYKMGAELRQKLRAHIKEDEMARFSHRFHDEGIVHRLASLARVKQDRMPDRWCQCSYLPNPQRAAMIHVRTKTIDGERRSKLENYNAVVRALE